MKTIKMIVGDLDDTILDDKKCISNRMIDVRNKLKNRGIFFTIATARSCDAANKYIDSLNPDYIISCDGGLISTREHILRSNGLSEEQFNRLYRHLISIDGVGKISIVSLHHDYKNYKGEILPQNPQGFDSEIVKVICEIFHEDQLRELQRINSDLLLSYYDREAWVRFSNREATKFNALCQLCETIGISLDSVMAFGDDYNDVEMIQNSGVGVAVSNAIEPVKDVANFIASDNESDGVANFIAEYFDFD